MKWIDTNSIISTIKYTWKENSSICYNLKCIFMWCSEGVGYHCDGRRKNKEYWWCSHKSWWTAGPAGQVWWSLPVSARSHYFPIAPHGCIFFYFSWILNVLLFVKLLVYSSPRSSLLTIRKNPKMNDKSLAWRPVFGRIIQTFEFLGHPVCRTDR